MRNYQLPNNSESAKGQRGLLQSVFAHDLKSDTLLKRHKHWKMYQPQILVARTVFAIPLSTCASPTYRTHGLLS